MQIAPRTAFAGGSSVSNGLGYLENGIAVKFSGSWIFNRPYDGTAMSVVPWVTVKLPRMWTITKAGRFSKPPQVVMDAAHF
jgi:hypothetical protein